MTKLEIRVSRKYTQNGPETVLGTFKASVHLGSIILSKPQLTEDLPAPVMMELRQLVRDHVRQFIEHPRFPYTYNEDHCIETFVRYA